ncbi:MAG: L-threonylcarbamoyladenylate synthase [Acutalibacteraceae bacterium]
METKLLKENEIDKAAQIIINGGLVAMPTETVYGLAANALNGEAVAKIFKAKGRPMDNPLIVHIADFIDIDRLTVKIPAKAYILAETFWPGPLTIILPKSDIIPKEVSAGLDTVAIRFPSHRLARELIRKAGVPLAAPSANLSGSPSPTAALHVYKDLNGKIDAILDGGSCSVGLESTVITFAGEKPRLLRPGGVTLEQMQGVIGEIDVDKAVLSKLEDGAVAASPGMKYKHYAPKARVIIIKADDRKYIEYINGLKQENSAALCYEEDMSFLNIKSYSMGKKDDSAAHAKNLFSQLRKIDEDNIAVVYARCPKASGVDMAVYNRLVRAAGFEVKNLEEL